MTTRFEQALDKLKMSGVRMTPQRYAILSYLLDSTCHPTADDIYRALEDRFPSMSVATVYNNLKVFIESGLVRELTFGDNSSRFDADMSNHYHAQCEQCGVIVDFHYPTLTDIEQQAAHETGFQVRGHRVEVSGICKECMEKNAHNSTH
ncbi:MULTISPECIES: peroxide-responsive transcriptional repressor PerR [Paenibacillus]|uniref:Peroxide-responsive transcriptional repressor PerR n=1 Tax=Paenibacillus residui TaxID=629724 RepID=A0ABW3DCN1_9BACL|nr:peroxide-responsive transcriptional repressor PerR [Paenibacillus sp. 32O-W]